MVEIRGRVIAHVIIAVLGHLETRRVARVAAFISVAP